MFDTKRPEWPAGRKVGIERALIGLKEMHPKVYESVMQRFASPQWAADKAIVDKASSLGWTPMRYLTEIGTHTLGHIGEKAFLHYWEETNLKFMDSTLLKGALNVLLGKAVTAKVVQHSTAPWSLSAVGCGDLSITMDPSGKAATVVMSNIPAELANKPSYVLGWRSVYTGLLRKCGEKNYAVSMESRVGQTKFTLHCKWG